MQWYTLTMHRRYEGEGAHWRALTATQCILFAFSFAQSVGVRVGIVVAGRQKQKWCLITFYSASCCCFW